MAFIQRLLSAQFTLGQGTFGNTGQNQVMLDGLRMSARIDQAGGAAMAQLSLDIWGMKLSDMNDLSTLGYVATTYRKNTVLLKAGDSGSMTTVFQGTVFDAYVDIQDQPDAHFSIRAAASFISAVAPAKPSSYSGSVDVVKVLANIAGQLNVPFEPNGVSVMLSNPYFSGSLRDQAQQAVEHAGLAWNSFGDPDGTLAVWPPGKFRGSNVPVVSASTGLVGYPAYQSNGISVRTLFNPSIGFGKKINVQASQLLQKQQTIDKKGNVTAINISGNGEWVVTMLNHRLDSKVPHGDWFTDMQACPPGYVVAP